MFSIVWEIFLVSDIAEHEMTQTHTTDIRKPAFRWLGIEGYRSSRTVEASCSDESHKRKFGTDITNASLKIRDLSVQTDSSAPNKKFQIQMKQDKKIIVVDSNIKEQDHKSYRFGPFAPVTISKGKLPRGESIPPRTPYDLENLASTYRPRYVNHGMSWILMLWQIRYLPNILCLILTYRMDRDCFSCSFMIDWSVESNLCYSRQITFDAYWLSTHQIQKD